MKIKVIALTLMLATTQSDAVWGDFFPGSGTPPQQTPPSPEVSAPYNVRGISGENVQEIRGRFKQLMNLDTSLVNSGIAEAITVLNAQIEVNKKKLAELKIKMDKDREEFSKIENPFFRLLSSGVLGFMDYLLKIMETDIQTMVKARDNLTASLKDSREALASAEKVLDSKMAFKSREKPKMSGKQPAGN